MKLITEIEIKNFRSIKECKIKEITEFNSLFGLNNSGKSNILRALNLFFNNETDNGQDLDFDLDFYQYPKKQKKKKEIKISVTFELPNNFRFQKRMESVKDFILKKSKKKIKHKATNRKIKIEKCFGREYFLPEKIKLNDILVAEKDLRTIDRFLNLINFRYIPNRVLPVDIIRREESSLKNAIVRKINKQRLDKKKIQKATKALAQALKNTSQSLIAPISEEFKKISNNTTVELITPNLIEELIAATSGYFINTGEIKVHDTYQGSGIQSFLMFHTLHLIDRDYAQQFGWKQATIWAVEEPESSLHFDLEAQLAMFLFKTVIKKDSRLQFFCTTHSTMFAQYSPKSVITEKKESETTCRAIESKEVYKESARLGISQHTHPLLFYPNKNILLCEGVTDVDFVKKIIEILGIDQQDIQITCLADLKDEQDSGGIDTICQYIKNNKEIINMRNNNFKTKIYVLFDWDVKENKFKNTKNIRGVSIIKWPQNQIKLETKKLNGIESLYPKKFIDEAFKNKRFKNTLAKDGNGHYTYVKGIDNSSIATLKKYLSQQIKSSLSKRDVIYLDNFIKQIFKMKK